MGKIISVRCTASSGDCDCVMCWREDGKPKPIYRVIHHDPWKSRSHYLIEIEEEADGGVAFGNTGRPIE